MGELSLMDISSEMERLDADCIVFYGSETGTAENYATRLATDGRGRFGLRMMVANPAEYNFETLHKLTGDKIVVFVLATTGDGEPTENAEALAKIVAGETPALLRLGDSPLKSLKFMMFGLGDSTHDHYNAMARRINLALVRLGAMRIGELGQGDDGEGTLEEDFLAWKEKAWAAYQHERVLRRPDAAHIYGVDVVEQPCLDQDSCLVYTGELNEQHLKGCITSPFDGQNPFVAQVLEVRELFNAKDRNCLHLDIDISGSGLCYHTGDHVAMWPMNPDEEVLRLLGILGLVEKQDTVVEIRATLPVSSLPPSPTTYMALFRHYLDICGPVSRQLVAALATFAPDAASRAEMVRLGSHKVSFAEEVTRPRINLGTLLETVGRGMVWHKTPLPLLIESIPRLSPRYYSICSSSLEEPWKISITAVVESRTVSGGQCRFHGVGTNYLLALKQARDGKTGNRPPARTYHIQGPRNRLANFKIPIHIRHSNFRLPDNPLSPVIMVGPGTGVAPFRAFLHERMYQKSNGASVGPMMLFFGCRYQQEDFLYQEEFAKMKRSLGQSFQIITAFSRQSNPKVYVQHRMMDMAADINSLIQLNGHFYVCGDGLNMAKEVKVALVQIISQERGLPVNEAESIVTGMKASKLYQEDVWA